MNAYIEIITPVSGEQESDMLVAQLSRIGFEGFQEEENLLHAFIPEAFYSSSALRQVLSSVQKQDDADSGPDITVNRIEPKNWNAEWEKDFHPVIVDDFCAVRAGFHEPVPGVKHDLLITPKMSFGTGHHATTYMMIEAMRQVDFSAAAVLDFGTGTGILAIFAEKLGATRIRAIDNDPWSIENAGENILANQAAHISVEQKESLQGEPVFDVILANINRQVILDSLPGLWQHLDQKGVVIASGVLQTDEEMLRQEAGRQGFLMEVLLIRDNWMSFSLKKH